MGFGVLRVTSLILLKLLSVVQELHEGHSRGAGEGRVGANGQLRIANG